MIAITLCATESYCYALPECLGAIQQNLAADREGLLILATDGGLQTQDAAQRARWLLPGWKIERLSVPVLDHAKNYEPSAQLVIAQLRSHAFAAARAAGAEECWSLDSDVIPPANALRVMRTALAFDAGFYDVATCPYPSAGGGGFLFGRGTPTRQICEDIYEDEREVPEELLAELLAHRALKERDQAWGDKLQAIEKRVRECPPRGNVFRLNATQWRKRGWGDMAYPAIGRGSMVPTDWCGFGCTLMSRRALALADFIGYEGKGTEDLFVVWNKWHPAGLRIAALPHALCHHVIRTPEGSPIGTPHTLCLAHHEIEGETAGHLRVRHLPWPAGASPASREAAAEPSRLPPSPRPLAAADGAP